MNLCKAKSRKFYITVTEGPENIEDDDEAFASDDQHRLFGRCICAGSGSVGCVQPRTNLNLLVITFIAKLKEPPYMMLINCYPLSFKFLV